MVAMASSDASQLAGALERRLACGNAAERRWADARRELVDAPQLADGRTDGVAELDRTVVDQPTQSPDAAAPPVVSKGERKEHEEAEAQIESRRRRQHLIEEQIAREEAARGGDAAQLSAGSADALAVTARLIPEHVHAIQQE